MPALLVLLFVLVPLVEIYIVLQVGSAIGAGWTIVLLVLDSLLGAWLLKVEGRRAWWQFRTALSEGRWPGDEVAQGALVLVGGALLLTPGFLTDAAGLLMLLPPSRRAMSRLIRARMVPGGRADRQRGGGGTGRQPGGLDVEVVEIEREQRPPPDDPTTSGGADR